MRTIYSFEKPHSVQSSLISLPPKGYQFIGDKSIADKSGKEKLKNKLSYNPLIKGIWELSKRFHNPVLKEYSRLSLIDTNPLVQKADLLLSGRILPTKKPYWIDLEHIRQLMGWDIRLFEKNKDWISNQISKDNCRLITSWTKAGINTVKENLPNPSNFENKCFYVHNAIPSADFKRKFESKEEIAFLFMSSYNLPYDFNFKGGNIALESFDRMSKNHSDIKLIVKSWVPKELIAKYSKNKRILFQGISPFSEMGKIFRETDIFLSPNHNTPAQAFLDCMNYSIPIITTDLWANSEIVKNNYNGLLISPSKNIPYFFGNNIPNSRAPKFNKAIEKVDEEMVKSLIEKAEKLIDSKNLRKKLGENGKKEIVSGEFSIKTRNKKYERLLDSHF